MQLIFIRNHEVSRMSKQRRRTCPPQVLQDNNPNMELTLNVKTVLRELDLTKYEELFDNEEVSAILHTITL